jgi:hypothetical protein
VGARPTEQFWELARREADQVQVQKPEALRRELELQRDALAAKEAELQQREASFEQARAKLDEALASSRQALAAMQDQMDRQQHDPLACSMTLKPRSEPDPVKWTPRSTMSVIHGRPVRSLATNQEPAVGG